MSKATVVIAAVAALTAGALTGADAPGGAAAGTSPVVRTADGAVRGTLTGTARVFQGIPYAAPPARWEPPRPVRAWRGVRDATEPGAACAQSGSVPVKGPRSDAEDCLFVNVTTPRATAPSPRPVMVWLHGGDHEDGEGAMYGAQRLAAGGDVVVVTVNYRLGALGYLGDGNFGLQDQQAALRWVRANVAAFGGDPGNVTLFGESGGARSVCANLVSPASAGLFHRAVLQSGPCLDDDGTLTRAEALRHARHLEDKFEQPLRTVSAAELVAADDEETRYGPAYGTRLLPRTPREAFASGRFNRVPVLHGINRDEETFRVYGLELVRQRLLDERDFRAYVTGVYGAEVAERALTRYPASAYGGSYGRALAAAMTDAVWGRPAIVTNDALGARTPTYAYAFSEQDNPWFKDFPRASFPVGAPHLAELPYLFDLDWSEPLTAEQRRLAAALTGIWSDFARTGRAPWKPYTPDAPHTAAVSSEGVRPTDLAKEHNYSFWKDL